MIMVEPKRQAGKKFLSEPLQRKHVRRVCRQTPIFASRYVFPKTTLAKSIDEQCNLFLFISKTVSIGWQQALNFEGNKLFAKVTLSLRK